MVSETIGNTHTASYVNSGLREARKKERTKERKKTLHYSTQRKRRLLTKWYLAICSVARSSEMPRPPRRDTDLLSAQELSNGKRCDVTITSP